MADAWNPATYDAFADARTAPFLDLLAPLRPVDSPTVVDLGCGTGRLTARLAEHTGAARVIGLDTSDSMLAAATAEPHDRCEFRHADIGAADLGALIGAPVDLVFSNAALHWVPDHLDALGRWAELVGEGGQLAVQIPANADHPSHLIADEIAAHPEMAPRFTSPPPLDPTREVRRPAEYAELLFDRGFRHPHVRTQVYPVILESTRSILEWIRGTSLTRFRSRLDDDGYAEFERRYEQRLVAELGDRSPYFFAFPRILMWGADRGRDSSTIPRTRDRPTADQSSRVGSATASPMAPMPR